MKIDSHHHFWKYDADEYDWIDSDMETLQRDFLPDELQALIEAEGIDQVVSVQASQTLEETRWLLKLAEQHSFVAGVVGWAPLVSPDVEQELSALTQSPYLKGIRHVVQSEPDDDFILRDDFNEGVSRLKQFGLVYDILIYARHLANTIQFVDRHPEQRFVLDHIAKPTIFETKFDYRWADSIRELARRDNVDCKFSGVATEVRDDNWSLATIRPYWQVALDAFGPERLMFGSDWPVCLLRSDYRQWHGAVKELAQELSPDEQLDLFGQSAMRAYNLDPAA